MDGQLEEGNTSVNRDHPPEFRIDPGASSPGKAGRQGAWSGGAEGRGFARVSGAIMGCVLGEERAATAPSFQVLYWGTVLSP